MNPLILKLEMFASLPEADRRLLDKMILGARAVGPHIDLASEGDAPNEASLVLEGFACRYKLLKNGRRQIMAYLIPGDFCDLQVFILKTRDHSIGTLSHCRVVSISQQQIFELMQRPAIALAFLMCALVDEATLREWLLNIGARDAAERVAHLLCELLLRLQSVGLANGSRYELPITQSELADTMGLSVVHISRVLRRLRANGLITLNGKKLVILDVAKLKEFSGFNPNYLHLAERRDATAQALDRRFEQLEPFLPREVANE